MDNIVYKFDISETNKEYIDHNLQLYNYKKNKYLNPIIYEVGFKEFGFCAYDNNSIVAGAYGFIDDGYWFFLDLLYVDENYRGMGIATNLMNQVENFAKENNCVGIRTETWSFQARGFYEKIGFTIYGELDNYPPYATNYLLKKVLITDERDFPKPVR